MLPAELAEMVLAHVPPDDLVRFQAVCKTFSEASLALRHGVRRPCAAGMKYPLFCPILRLSHAEGAAMLGKSGQVRAGPFLERWLALFGGWAGVRRRFGVGLQPPPPELDAEQRRRVQQLSAAMSEAGAKLSHPALDVERDRCRRWILRGGSQSAAELAAQVLEMQRVAESGMGDFARRRAFAFLELADSGASQNEMVFERAHDITLKRACAAASGPIKRMRMA